MDMTHPDILKMERDGYLGRPAREPKFIGECAECGEAIYFGYDHYIDEEGRKYCDADCALKWYRILASN